MTETRRRKSTYSIESFVSFAFATLLTNVYINAVIISEKKNVQTLSKPERDTETNAFQSATSGAGARAAEPRATGRARTATTVPDAARRPPTSMTVRG